MKQILSPVTLELQSCAPYGKNPHIAVSITDVDLLVSASSIRIITSTLAPLSKPKVCWDVTVMLVMMLMKLVVMAIITMRSCLFNWIFITIISSFVIITIAISDTYIIVIITVTDIYVTIIITIDDVTTNSILRWRQWKTSWTRSRRNFGTSRSWISATIGSSNQPTATTLIHCWKVVKDLTTKLVKYVNELLTHNRSTSLFS